MKKNSPIHRSAFTLFAFVLLFFLDPVKADAISDHLSQWQKKRPAHFQYRSQRSCYCPALVWLVEAEGATVTHATPVVFSSQPPTPSLPGLSIDSLFDWLRKAQSESPYRLDVTYDSTYGFPATIYLDRKQNVADDEETRSVSEFTVLPTVTLRTLETQGTGARISPDRQRTSHAGASGTAVFFYQGNWIFDLRGRSPIF